MKNFKSYLVSLFILFNCHQFVIAKNNYINSYSGLRVRNGEIEAKDLEIISEINTINILDVKAAYIWFYITKKIRYKVLTIKGVERISKISIPEMFDPFYISHFPKYRKYTTLYSNLKSLYFQGFIIGKDKEKINAVVKKKYENANMVMVEKDYYGNYDKYNFQIENIEVGDEVEIEYSYKIPFGDNFLLLSSFRIFFNSDLYKENYELKLTHRSNLTVKFFFANDAKPDTITDIDKETTYYWKRKQLKGCINEAGSRPYLSLPHVIFSIQPTEMLYTLPYSFEEKYIPFYALYANQREFRHFGIYLSIAQKVTTKEYIDLKKYVEEETKDIVNDSLGYLKLIKLFNNISDEFKFDNDTNYFKRIDPKDPNIGKDLNAKTIRDINRYEVYIALLLKIGLQYYTAYLCDIRTGEINNEYFAPMWDNDYILVVFLKNNLVQFMLPKSNEFGYYLNELPFYYENAKARLVCLYDYINLKLPIYERLRQIQMPNSNISDNTRRSSVFVKINTDSLTSNFDAKINLSGQYSTLMRGLYLYNYKDQTINSLYHKKIWEINNEVKLLMNETSLIEKEFPFPALVKAKYKANNIIRRKDDTLLIDMKNWFNHIIYSDFDITDRQMDYYSDFYGTDTYVYFLQFEKNVKLLDTTSNIEVKNDFGDFIFNVEQLNPNSVKITSFHKISNAIITVDKIQAVKDIFDKIQTVNNSILILKVE